MKTAWGELRIQDPQDWVRVEIGTAIRTGVKVIPVLWDGGKMPTVGSLPEDLRRLARIERGGRQAEPAQR